MAAWLTVVIPAHNAEQYLAECLNSILPIKEYTNKIILIDDCSSDKTAIVAEQWKDNNNIPLTVIRNEANLGPSASRNIGIKLADSSHIMFLDSDDTLTQEIADFLERGKKFDYTCSVHNQVRFDPSGKEIQSSTNYCGLRLSENRDEEIYKRVELQKYLHNYLRLPREFCLLEHCWGRLYRAEIIADNQIIFTESANQLEDVEFNLKYLSHVNQIAIYLKPIYNHMLRVSNRRLSNQAGLSDDAVDRLYIVSSQVAGLLRGYLDEQIINLEVKKFLASKISGYIAKLCLINEASWQRKVSLEHLMNTYHNNKFWEYIELREDESQTMQYMLKIHAPIQLISIFMRLRKKIHSAAGSLRACFMPR